MRWQTTAALAVILVALGAFYYAYEIRLGPEREKTEARKGRLFAAEMGDVTAVEVKRGAEALKFQRDWDGWRMLVPVATRADRGAVDELITAVVTAKPDREISANPASLAEYGLDSPTADITLTVKDGKQLGLQLGGKNPTGVWVYGREVGKSAVLALPDSVLRDATRPVTDYRDKTVLAFDRSNVTGLDIATPDEGLGLESADGKWTLTRPVPRPADPDVVGDFLEKLGAARVKEFVAENPASLQDFGLDRPVRMDIHTGRDKDRATKTLLVGRADPAKQGVYAMRPGETSVLLLPDELDKALPRNVAALRDKTVLSFDRDKIAKIEIDGPKGAVTLARENNQWRITAPEAMAADQVEAGALLQKLSTLKAQAFLTDDASGIPRYLAKPALRVTVTDDGGRATSVLLGPSAERRGAQPSAYAAVAERGPLVLVSASALDDLGRTANDLRDRRLLGSLEPKMSSASSSSGAARPWYSSARARGSGAWWSRRRARPRAPRSTTSSTPRGPSNGETWWPRGERIPGATDSTLPSWRLLWGAATAARSARFSWASARATAFSCAPRPLPPSTPWRRASSATFPTCPTTSRGSAMTTSAENAIYLEQMELGPMQNFAYLIGDPVARQCVVVDPAWEIETIVATAQRDGMALVGALVTHTHQDHVGEASSPGVCPGASRAWRSCSAACPSRFTSTRRSANSSRALGQTSSRWTITTRWPSGASP